MIRLRHKLLIQILRGMDQLVLFGTLAGIIYFRSEMTVLHKGYQFEESFRFWDAFGLPLLAIGWLCAFHAFIQYRGDRLSGFRSQLKDVVKATTLATFWLLIISAVFSIYSVNTLNLFLFWAIVTAYGVLSRVFLRSVLVNARKSGYNYRYLLFIGANDKGREMAEKVNASPELGFKIVGFCGGE